MFEIVSTQRTVALDKECFQAIVILPCRCNWRNIWAGQAAMQTLSRVRRPEEHSLFGMRPSTSCYSHNFLAKKFGFTISEIKMPKDCDFKLPYHPLSATATRIRIWTRLVALLPQKS
jgi:hypothetical protein